jgi:hypothetical protein
MIPAIQLVAPNSQEQPAQHAATDAARKPTIQTQLLSLSLLHRRRILLAMGFCCTSTFSDLIQVTWCVLVGFLHESRR